MSVFTGPQQPGAMRAHRAALRSQAEDRNAACPVERTAKFRRDRAVVQSALADARARRAGPPMPDTAQAACVCGHSTQMHQLAETGFCLSAGCHCARYRPPAEEAVA